MNTTRRLYLVCVQCGKSFSDYLSKRDRKYCSTKCYDIARSSNSEIRACPICHNEFKANGCEITKGGAKYCSRQCARLVPRNWPRINRVTKVCPKCKAEKAAGDFYKSEARRDGLSTWCKDCISKAGKEKYKRNPSAFREKRKLWRINNPEKVKAHLRDWRAKNTEKIRKSNRKDGLKRKYNLTVEEIDQIEIEQKGLCLICSRKKKLVVDHCHNTGSVRGLLCENCNRGLGLFAEEIEWLLNAAQYIAKWQKAEAQSNQLN